MLKMVIQALIIESQGRKILVDTCLGNDKKNHFPDWSNMQGPFLRTSPPPAYPRESIDNVVCTHLHIDHVGWNTMKVGDRWVPTFPNARYLIGRTSGTTGAEAVDPRGQPI